MNSRPNIPKRMQAVQDPVIPIVGEWTRDNPGTISLGQGVVSWGPPPEVYEALGKFREDPSNQKYKLVQGIPELLDAIEQKLARDNSIVVDALQLTHQLPVHFGLWLWVAVLLVAAVYRFAKVTAVSW